MQHTREVKKMPLNFSSCLKMGVQFTKTMIIVLVLCNMSTSKADLGYTMVKMPQLISSVRQHQESLTHQRFGVTNNTTMNQKLWLNMKQMLAQLNRKQMNQQTKLSDLFLLRDAIKTKKHQQELQENSGKNEATNVRKTYYGKNRGTVMKNISHVEMSGSVNRNKVFPTDINIPKATSQQLNVYLKFLDRMIKNRINLLKKVTNNSLTRESASVDDKVGIRNKVIHDSPPNMTAESARVDEKAEIWNKLISHPNMMLETATVDENAEKAEILKFISRNSVNETIQSTPLDEDSEKVAILKLISRHQKTENGDLTQKSFGDLEKPNNVQLSTWKNIDELNREVVITTIQTYQNDGILNQNTSQDNEITRLNLNIPDEIIKPRNATVEQFILSGNLTKQESHVSNEIMSDEVLTTRRRQKSDPHRHPTERDLSKHSLEKGLPSPNKGNGRLRNREGHSSKFRNGENEMYPDNVDTNQYDEDPFDGALADPLGIAADEPKPKPEQDTNSGMGLMEILILIMICIIVTQCCILALLFVLKDKLIVNLTFKYGQIKV
uniref:Uncharacterized protein n=1 Tax=Cacopsylla melanoneura TaxID=428564 RepID=A0A8D8T0X7_9HEMI